MSNVSAHSEQLSIKFEAMKVAIVGSGYVGLVTGACLASQGHTVVCVDMDCERIRAINDGKAPFFEPGLPELLSSVRSAGNFSASTDLVSAAKGAQVVMVAVGTPTVDGKIDLTAMGTALAQVGSCLADSADFKTVVVKSTVVPGTTDTFARECLERASGKVAGKGFGIAMNPEFLREGSAISDFQFPDRIVIGVLDDRSRATLAGMYGSYAAPKVFTTPRNAEMIKYSSNSLLATLISFSNELALLCERAPGLDISVVMDGLHLDKRLSPIIDGKRVEPGLLSYIRAGAGFGGSCLPKDIAALKEFASHQGVEMHLLSAVERINMDRPRHVGEIVEQELGGLGGRKVAILGLAFKPDTDDLRESAGLRLADALHLGGARVAAIDPLASMLNARSIPSWLAVSASPESAFEQADAVILMTAWPQFLEWPWDALLSTMRNQLIVDGRNALRQLSWPEGTTYRPIGTSKVQREATVHG